MINPPPPGPRPLLIYIFFKVIQCIGEKVHGDSALSALVQTIEKVFDVELSESRCRFIVKPGVDDVLDEKKRG